MPAWDRILEMAARCYEMTCLGYLGVDIVVDRELGPLILELNARPGLAIQIANGSGLRHRLQAVEELGDSQVPVQDRLDFCRQEFRQGTARFQFEMFPDSKPSENRPDTPR
jgi:hypothetical protein